MRKIDKNIIITLITIIGIITLGVPMSYGFVAKTYIAAPVVSRGVAILLSCMQVLEFVVPVLFFIIKIIINKRKQNNKNTFKNICLYLLISVIIFLLFVGVGALILKNTSSYGYSSKSIDYIHYNGKVIYYHR